MLSEGAASGSVSTASGSFGAGDGNGRLIKEAKEGPRPLTTSPPSLPLFVFRGFGRREDVGEEHEDDLRQQI